MVKEELWRTLLDLKEVEFKSFKWFLEQGNLLEGCSGIPVSRLEMAERKDTVDLMVQNYQDDGARELTKKILEKIGRNDLVLALVRKDLKNHKKEQLAETNAEIKQGIQERQKRIDEIRRSAEISRKSADRHIADSRQVFEVLQKSVKRSLADLIEEIEKKQETSRKRTQGFIRELEKEISELTKISDKVEQLSRSEDILQSVQSLHAIPFTTNWTEISFTPPTYGGSVGKALNLFEEIFKKEKEKLIAKAKLKRVQESEQDVTLDPETANAYLVLSDDRKRVYYGDVKQSLPDNPERCDPGINVLGKQSFSSGRFYYEVLVKGKSSWDLGVVKGSIARKEKINAKPQNGYWTICLREGNKYQASAVNLTVKRQPERVGVFVDHEKGSVYFYDVDSADVIHNFTDCAFTETLYPFFSPGLYYDGKNSAPLIISPVDYSD